MFLALGDTLTVTTTDFTWVGVHTIKIRGQNGAGDKQYETIDSDEFTIEFINPCTRTVVESFELDDMLTSINVGTNVTQTFTNKRDAFSVLYATQDGYSLCGDRYVYMMKADSPTTEPGESSVVIPYMRLYLNETDNEDSPLQDASTVWELVLYTEDVLMRGEYEFLVYIELADYPTATPAVAEFLVSVDPCIVTSLEPPADLDVTYIISPEAELSTIEYNFAQSPCAYAGTYTATMTEGDLDWNVPFPTFLTQYEDEGVMTIYSRDELHVGNYTIEVCVELENLYNWMEKDGLYDPTDTSRKYDSDYPPEDLNYTDCFNINVSMNVSDNWDGYIDEAFVEDFNSAPVLVVTPRDIAIWAGEGLYVDFGNVFDAEGDQASFNLDLGRAQSFANFDIFTYELTIDEGVTSNFTAGRYPIKITLTDDAPTSRGGPKATVYQFDLYIRFRPLDFEGDAGSSNINTIVTAEEIYPILPEPGTGDGGTGGEDGGDTDPDSGSTEGQGGTDTGGDGDGTDTDEGERTTPTGLPALALPDNSNTSGQGTAPQPTLIESSDDFSVTD